MHKWRIISTVLLLRGWGGGASKSYRDSPILRARSYVILLKMLKRGCGLVCVNYFGFTILFVWLVLDGRFGVMWIFWLGSSIARAALCA